MSDAVIEIGLDERIRLVTAVLAASSWPEREQAETTHAVHPHSKQTKQYVASHRNHQAVAGLDNALDAGVSLHDIFAAAVRATWPDFQPQAPVPAGLDKWLATLPDFAATANLAPFWGNHAAPWDEAIAGLQEILTGKAIIGFLEKLTGQPLPKTVYLMPTVNYPLLHPVLAETADQLYFILPPAKAWGESSPWPHGEDPGWVVIQTAWHLSRYFWASQLAALDEARQTVLIHAAVTLCLEAELEEEAMAYLVRAKKEHKLPQLPAVVEQLRDYLTRPTGDLSAIF